MRCSSLAGFHGRSTLITALAACRLSPTLPLSVDRNSRQAGSCLKRTISARRRCCGTEPVCQAHSTPISAASSRTSSSMRSHSENTMTLRSGSASRSPRMPSSSSSLGLMRQVGIEDRRRVADHAHAGEQHLQPLELLPAVSGRRCAIATRARGLACCSPRSAAAAPRPSARNSSSRCGRAARSRRRALRRRSITGRSRRAARRGSCSRSDGRARRARRSRG